MPLATERQNMEKVQANKGTDGVNAQTDIDKNLSIQTKRMLMQGAIIPGLRCRRPIYESGLNIQSSA